MPPSSADDGGIITSERITHVSNSDDNEQPQKDYLGRILIGFIALAAILWGLTYIF